MKLIVGLGNPGKKYINTRHNAGFLAVDYILSDDMFLQAKPSHEFKSEMFTWNNSERIIFLKPQTFMNDSGQALRIISNFYKLNLSRDLLVIHDDVDLPVGSFKKSANSSSAGHKGMQSIIDALGTQNFNRIRIGVESRENKQIPPTDAFVLQEFAENEKNILQSEIFPEVLKEVIDFLEIKEQKTK
jgi:peptidyl-tRNA hydrolase, PTH1 family